MLITPPERAYLQDEINDMISNYHHYVGIWPRSHVSPFSEVFDEEGSGENHQEDVVTYDGDRSINR